MELMYRCMFLAPVSFFQEQISSLSSGPPSSHPHTVTPSQGHTVTLPFVVDAEHQHGCETVMGEEGTEVTGTGGNSYCLGQLALDNGSYSWKVKVQSANAAFCVGVAQKPLSVRQVGSSNQFWLLESHTGRLYHEGESNDLLFTVTEGDTITVVYDSVTKTLAFGKNSERPSCVFQNVAKQGRDLFPAVIFPRRRNRTTVGTVHDCY